VSASARRASALTSPSALTGARARGRVGHRRIQDGGGAGLAARAATQAARRHGVLIADFVTCAAAPSRLGRTTQPVLRGVRALRRHLQLSTRPRTRLGGFIKSSGRRTCASRPPSARRQRQRCHRAGCKYLHGQTLTVCAACAGSMRTIRSRRSGASRSSWDPFPRAAVSSAFPAVSRSAVELRA